MLDLQEFQTHLLTAHSLDTINNDYTPEQICGGIYDSLATQYHIEDAANALGRFITHLVTKYNLTEELATSCCGDKPLELWNFDPELLCQHIIYQAALRAAENPGHSGAAD